VPNVLKSGSLNLLEPSGPVQACNGITLPLPLPLYFTPPSWYCLLFRHHHCGTVSCSDTTIVVLSPVHTPPLWYCLLFRHHHCGTVSCSDTTIMVLSPVQTPPLWYCLLFRHHHYGTVSCSDTTIMVMSPVQTPPLWYCLLFRHHPTNNIMSCNSINYKMTTYHFCLVS